MPEKTKPEKKREQSKPENAGNLPENAPRGEKKSSWAEDQREKSYYYDDAHGYEIYNPDEEDETDEN